MLKHYAILYFATLIIMTAMDMLWLGVVARDFYRERIGDMIEFHFLPAILFYLMYVAGILVFASAGPTDGWRMVALYGGLLGFLAYATYDLTNMATLKHWPLSLVVVDIAWGVFTTAFSATAGWMVARYFRG